MSRTKCCASIVAIVLTAGLGGGIFGQSEPQGTPVEIRKTEERVVLYTIHRGSFDKVGATIAEAIATAAQKGVYPRGSISFAYLNNPQTTPSEHWLTEIRIPVGSNAMKLAGTLGRFTDIKKLPAADMAVAVKPEGLAAPESVYRRLYAWMFENGYMPTDGPSEVFLSNAQTGDYAKMKSEIMLPVRKMSKAQQIEQN